MDVRNLAKVEVAGSRPVFRSVASTLGVFGVEPRKTKKLPMPVALGTRKSLIRTLCWGRNPIPALRL